MPISPPNVSKKRQLARKLFDAFLSGVPIVGGPMAALYSVTHPAKGEIEEERWRADVSALLNSLEEAVSYLTNSIMLSEDAACLGEWIASVSESGGRFDIIEHDRLADQFHEASKLELLEAIGELENEGMVVLSKAIGKQFVHLRPTHKLFEVFDPIVFPDVSPREDAATIAEELLSSERGVSAEYLSEKYGWSSRRLNPALAIVGEFIGEGRKSSPMGQPYVIRAMFVDPGERARLRRFLNEVRGN